MSAQLWSSVRGLGSDAEDVTAYPVISRLMGEANRAGAWSLDLAEDRFRTPAMKSAIDGPAPRYGTETTSMPVDWRNCSPARCTGVPRPGSA